MLGNRHPDGEENMMLRCMFQQLIFDVATIIFRMFQGECCMKHGVHVAAGIFVSENQTT